MTTANTKTLIAELSWIDRFVSKKATIPVLSTVQMKASGDFLKLIATDLETSGITFCDVTGDGSWQTCVPVKALLKYLAKVEEAEVSLVGTAAGLDVSHGDNKVSILADGVTIEHFPELPAELETIGTVSGLDTVIPQVSIAMSPEESRFSLNGALLRVKDGAAVLVSTDGHRLSHVELQDSAFDKDVSLLVSKRALGELGRIVKDSSVRVSADEKHIGFSIGHRKIISRKLTGNFPDYERVMPRDFATTFDVDQKPLHKLVERIKTMSDERSKVARWKLADGALTLTAEQSGKSRAKGSLKVDAPASDWEAGLNCDYALDFLKLADNVSLSVKDAGSAAQFQSGAWKYIVMPCRISKLLELRLE